MVIKPKPTFIGSIQKGKLFLNDEERYEKLLRAWSGKSIQLMLKQYNQDRTLNQNAYYWGVVIRILCEHIGYEDPQDMHNALKMKYLRKYALDEDYPTIESTTNLDTKEFNEFLELIKLEFQNKYDIIIPEPTQITY